MTAIPVTDADREAAVRCHVDWDMLPEVAQAIAAARAEGAAEEREACAMLCDARSKRWRGLRDDCDLDTELGRCFEMSAFYAEARYCAAIIRARCEAAK